QEMLKSDLQFTDNFHPYLVYVIAVFKITIILGPPVLFTRKLDILALSYFGNLVRANIRFDPPVIVLHPVFIEFMKMSRCRPDAVIVKQIIGGAFVGTRDADSVIIVFFDVDDMICVIIIIER